MANEFQRSSGEAVHESTTSGLGRSPGASGVVFFLESDDVDFEDIAGGDDEVGDGASFAAGGGPDGVEVVGLDGRDAGDEVGSGVSHEPRGAVLDPRRPVHHFVRREAHL